MNSRNLLRFVAFVLVAFNILLQVDTYPGQRAYHNGMRYGRSESLKQMGSRRTMLVPGGERFIMGTRYGKRSRDFGELPALLCTYSGIANLYRCDQRDEKETGNEEQMKE